MYSLESLLRRMSGEPPDCSMDTDFKFVGLRPGRQLIVHSYANFVVFRGNGLVIPYWSLVVLAMANALGILAMRPISFGIRAMFLAITLVAALLGAVQIVNN
jgi:hypothetical protein